MDLHHIRYFLAVCDTLNFTKAAEKCNISQPALSRAVQQLEEDVGGQLVHRERNLTHLTDLGQLMQPHFDRVMSELGSAKLDARRFLTLENAELNLGIMCTVGPVRFADLLSHFSGVAPGISLRIVEGIPKKLSENLLSGNIDVALMASAQGFPERFDVEELYRERFVLAFPAGHRFSVMKAVPIAEINGENYLRRINCEYRDYLSDLADSCGADVHLGHASEREDWIMNMVAAGLGICFIPEYSAVLPGIQTRAVIEPEVWRSVSLVTLAGRRHSPAVATFVKAVRSYKFTGSQLAPLAAVAS
jgi:LysR family transcriptional regulator, hydrogen peroxide-inducible genes activator